MSWADQIRKAALALASVFLALLLGTAWTLMVAWAPWVARTLEPLPAASEALRNKVQAVDVDGLNRALGNVERTTGNAEAVTADLRGALPKIHRSVFYLWKHTDRTLGHLDESTSAARAEQREIAAQTVQMLESVNRAVADVDRVATNPDLPLAISHVRGVAANGEAAMQHVNHVAEHYDRQFTAPKRWWHKLYDGFSAAAIWCGRHL